MKGDSHHEDPLILSMLTSSSNRLNTGIAELASFLSFLAHHSKNLREEIKERCNAFFSIGCSWPIQITALSAVHDYHHYVAMLFALPPSDIHDVLAIQTRET
jgi:hypothetical protein